MRVLMFGWEFPPFKSGGLGTACKGMASALAARGTDVVFVLPRTGHGQPQETEPGLTLLSASGTRLHGGTVRVRHEGPARGERRFVTENGWYALDAALRRIWEHRLHLEYIDSPLHPYLTEEGYLREYGQWTARDQLTAGKRAQRSILHGAGMDWLPGDAASRDVPLPDREILLHGGYGQDLMQEVRRYACAAAAIARRTPCDIIHAHDWMTYPAGMLAKHLTGKPLVVHIHALESDRSGHNVNQAIADLERAGMEAADKVIAVSHYTKQLVMRDYGIPESKIVVVHNAVSRNDITRTYPLPPLCAHEKRVLFMGRITYQKGPDYFVEAARLVLDRLPHTRFIMAGSGDMLPNMVRRVGQLRMGSRFHFTGFLKNEDVDRMYAMSDVYVMPSVSEPFGIAPLEAMAYDVPVIVSRQSGVVEVLRNAIRVDFWDVREMANKICALLTYPVLAAEEVRNCREELKHIRWENAAGKIRAVYDSLVTGRN